jgi:hypothetical protein
VFNICWGILSRQKSKKARKIVPTDSGRQIVKRQTSSIARLGNQDRRAVDAILLEIDQSPIGVRERIGRYVRPQWD